MYKTLLITEFKVSFRFLVLASIANVFFFLVLGSADEPDLIQFIGITTALFLIKLTIMAITAGDQKRTRLYAQLPVTASESFLASWTFVLVWLFVQTLVWVLFALVWGIGFSDTSLAMIFATGLSVATMVAIVSTGIDLVNFRPIYVLWSYIATIILLLALSTHAGAHFSVISFDDQIRVFPFILLQTNGTTPGGWLIALTLFGAFWYADYWVFRHSDHYLT